MSELIDRQAALDVLCDACGNCACPKGKIPRCSYYEKMQAIPAASPWHRAEDEPKEPGKQYVVWASKGYAYCDKWLCDRWLISSVAPETVTHWMPIEPPEEEEHGN